MSGKDDGLGDVVAEWEVRLADGVHRVQLEHGTTSGKRVVIVDGKEVFRKNWMFHLVGVQHFNISSKPAEVIIMTKGLMFEYILRVDGKSLKRFVETQAKNTRTWHPVIGEEKHRVVLDIETMDVYADGEKMDTCGEFTDTGTETHFSLAAQPARIKATSSGNKRKGLVYSLVVGNTELEPATELSHDSH